MQTLLETLPKQEKKAAEFLLDNLQSFSSQSIQGVAARAGVSDATYIRLAKRMGYSGFAEFKRNLIVVWRLFLIRCRKWTEMTNRRSF